MAVYRARDTAPVWFVVAGLCAWFAHRWFPGPQLWNYPWTLAVAPIVTSGMLLLVGSVGWFRRQETAIRPFAPVTFLVREGSHRFTRNPMYPVLVTMLAVAAVVLAGATCWRLPSGFALVLHRRFAVREQAFPTVRVGGAYRDFLPRCEALALGGMALARRLR